MIKPKQIIVGVLVVFAVLAISGSVFILDETEQAIVTQFGRPVGAPRVKPGVNVKLPFIQKVQFFDKRYLAWDGHPNQVPTKDKKFMETLERSLDSQTSVILTTDNELFKFLKKP